MRWLRYLLVVGIFLCVLAVRQWPDEKLHLVFCDVGQGDASLIILGDIQVLVDTGPKNGGVIDCLSRNMPFWDRELEVVINTHPEADHFGDIEVVSSHYKVGRLIMDGKMPSEKLAVVIKGMVEEGTKLMVASAGDRLQIGGVEMRVIWPSEKTDDLLAWVKEPSRQVLGRETGLNRFSIVTRLSYGNFSALITGDIGFSEEEKILESRRLTESNLVKIAHHGSKYSSSDSFLAKVSPEVAVISVGKNSYGHPTKEVLEKLAALSVAMFRTDQDGEVRFVSDGKGYWREK